MNSPKNYFQPNALMPLLTSRLLVLESLKKGCHFFGVQQVGFEFTEVPFIVAKVATDHMYECNKKWVTTMYTPFLRTTGGMFYCNFRN